MKENLILTIKTVEPYAKTIEIPVTIENSEYVQDGLIVWYDGIENTRNGHNSSSSTWENLLSTEYDGVLKNIDFTETSGWTIASI